MEKQIIDESKYIQQHLANERTFLAWLRTAIAIVGIGFLSVSLHFNYGAHVNRLTDRISIVMMVFAIAIGLFILLIGAISYQSKRKDINNGVFRSLSMMITIITVVVSILILLSGFYFIRIL